MKYISFVVPCFNSEAYMEKCIDSLLIGKEDVEIIIIDDGSNDNTYKIALKYQKRYPNIVKAITQENGGHGEGINTGLKHATGKYFKVVDSDDWVDEKAYKKVLNHVKKCDSDLIITNYVYSFTDGRKDQTISFKNVFIEGIESSWNDTKRFKMTQYLSLHSMMYKKSILDECDIELPKHVFYEDNLFIYWPLPKVKTLTYLDADFYRYFIGRADQSVNINQVIKKSSHQVLVTKETVCKHDLDLIENKKLRKLMKRELIFLCTIAVVFSRLSKTKDGENQYKEMWIYIREHAPKIYKEIRYKSLATLVSFGGPIGRFIAINGYKFAHKLVKFY